MALKERLTVIEHRKLVEQTVYEDEEWRGECRWRVIRALEMARAAAGGHTPTIVAFIDQVAMLGVTAIPRFKGEALHGFVFRFGPDDFSGGALSERLVASAMTRGFKGGKPLVDFDPNRDLDSLRAIAADAARMRPIKGVGGSVAPDEERRVALALAHGSEALNPPITIGEPGPGKGTFDLTVIVAIPDSVEARGRVAPDAPLVTAGNREYGTLRSAKTYTKIGERDGKPVYTRRDIDQSSLGVATRFRVHGTLEEFNALLNEGIHTRIPTVDGRPVKAYAIGGTILGQGAANGAKYRATRIVNRRWKSMSGREEQASELVEVPLPHITRGADGRPSLEFRTGSVRVRFTDHEMLGRFSRLEFEHGLADAYRSHLAAWRETLTAEERESAAGLSDEVERMLGVGLRDRLGMPGVQRGFSRSSTPFDEMSPDDRRTLADVGHREARRRAAVQLVNALPPEYAALCRSTPEREGFTLRQTHLRPPPNAVPQPALTTMIDVDKCKVPSHDEFGQPLDLAADPEKVIAWWVRHNLPPEFHSAALGYQLSSSAAMIMIEEGDPSLYVHDPDAQASKLSCHLFPRLATPQDPRDFSAWLGWHAARTNLEIVRALEAGRDTLPDGRKIAFDSDGGPIYAKVDESPQKSPNQPLFIGGPDFIGTPDPLEGRRWGYRPGHETVQPSVTLSPEQMRAEAEAIRLELQSNAGYAAFMKRVPKPPVAGGQPIERKSAEEIAAQTAKRQTTRSQWMAKHTKRGTSPEHLSPADAEEHALDRLTAELARRVGDDTSRGQEGFTLAIMKSIGAFANALVLANPFSAHRFDPADPRIVDRVAAAVNCNDLVVLQTADNDRSESYLNSKKNPAAIKALVKNALEDSLEIYGVTQILSDVRRAMASQSMSERERAAVLEDYAFFLQPSSSGLPDALAGRYEVRRDIDGNEVIVEKARRPGSATVFEAGGKLFHCGGDHGPVPALPPFAMPATRCQASMHVFASVSEAAAYLHSAPRGAVNVAVVQGGVANGAGLRGLATAADRFQAPPPSFATVGARRRPAPVEPTKPVFVHGIAATPEVLGALARHRPQAVAADAPLPSSRTVEDPPTDAWAAAPVVTVSACIKDHIDRAAAAVADAAVADSAPTGTAWRPPPLIRRPRLGVAR